MQRTLRARLVLMRLAIAVGAILESGAVRADPGDKIKRFLGELVNSHLAVELDHIDPETVLRPQNVGPVPLSEGKFAGAYFPAGCCGDDARKELNAALQGSSQPLRSTFRPDYCVVHWNDDGRADVLWIGLVSQGLRMRYYASTGVSDQCCIKANTTAHSVQQKLGDIFKNATSRMISNIINACVKKPKVPREPGVPIVSFELMSIDPTPARTSLARSTGRLLDKSKSRTMRLTTRTEDR